jgi:hypothetical protein
MGVAKKEHGRGGMGCGVGRRFEFCAERLLRGVCRVGLEQFLDRMLATGWTGGRVGGGGVGCIPRNL